MFKCLTMQIHKTQTLSVLWLYSDGVSMAEKCVKKYFFTTHKAVHLFLPGWYFSSVHVVCIVWTAKDLAFQTVTCSLHSCQAGCAIHTQIHAQSLSPSLFLYAWIHECHHLIFNRLLQMSLFQCAEWRKPLYLSASSWFKKISLKQLRGIQEPFREWRKRKDGHTEDSYSALAGRINKANILEMGIGTRVQTEQRDTFKKGWYRCRHEDKSGWMVSRYHTSFYFKWRGCFGKTVRCLECSCINGMKQ